MAKSGTLRLQDVLNGYWVGKRLGIGARSEVYEVKRKSDGELFAAKFINYVLDSAASDTDAGTNRVNLVIK